METSRGMLTTSFIVFTSLTAVVYGHSMTIRVEPTILLEGGNIEARCDVSNLKGGSLFIVWFRRGPIGKEVEIGTSGHVNKVFSRTGRYTANHKYHDNSTAQYFLSIRDAKTSDSGEIGCRIPNSFEISKVVSVITPVSNMQLLSKDDENAYSYANGDEVTFDEAQVINVTCKINSSFPQPNISIWSGSRDISDLFRSSHRLVAVQSTRWTPSFHYESMATPASGELMIRYEMNQQNLTCSALHHGSLLPPVEISILIKLDKYLPKFDCPVKIEARKYQENFRLICLIHANPGVEDAFVRWKKFLTFTETLLPNSSTGNYRLRVEYGATNTGSQTKLELLIGRMFPQTFRTYHVVASSAFGRTTHEVVVRETAGSSFNNEEQRLRSLSSTASFLPVLLLLFNIIIIITTVMN